MSPQGFANILTLLLVILKLVFGWPGTWLLAFSPLWVVWGIWATLYIFVLIYVGIGLLIGLFVE